MKIHSPRQISTETAISTQTNLRQSFPTKIALTVLWFVGIAFMLTRLIVGWYRLGCIVLSAKQISENEQLANIIGRRLKVLLTSQVDSPVCFGLLQPVILLPEEMYRQSSPEDLKMVLSHELAHIERRDCWTNLFQRLIEAIFFFHPFVWYASFQLTQQREQICDNHVLAKGASATNYVKLLSRIVEQGFEKNYLQAVALFEGRLLSRVRSLLDPEHNSQTKASGWTTLIIMTIVSVFLLFGTIRLEAKPDVSTFSKDMSAGESIRPQKETLVSHKRRPKGDCSISGKVISAETEEPVGHAKVYLFYVGTHAAMFIDVASDGTFEFKNIPTGPFSLRTIHTSGFQDAIYNPESNHGDYPQFTLKDREQRTDVVLKVESAYSIAGTVLGENAKSLKDSQLSILAWVELDEPGGNLNRYKIAKQKRVASDGTYLLDGLDGRPVFVMAIDWNAENKDDYYPPCYYPGTVARNEAKKVSFDKAKSVDGINIHLQKEGEFILEGTITDEVTGKAISKALVTIHHRDMLFDRVTTYTDEDGHYRVESLGAGDFLVHIDAEPWGYVRTRKPAKIETAKVTKLNFALRPAAKISGKIVDENGNPIEISSQAYGLAYREGYSTPETMSWSGARSKYGIKGKGHGNTFNGGEGDYEEEYMDFPTPSTFVIEGMIPGKTVLRFHPKSQGQALKEILYNGQNITETGIETKPGEEIKDIIIVVGTP